MTRTIPTGWSALVLALPLTCSAPPAASASLPQARDGTLPLHDCNGNGVEDAVDIARGTCCDTDLDGVPDECQAGAPLSAGPPGPVAEALRGAHDDGTSPPRRGS